MSIWKNPITLETINARGKNSMVEWLDIEFTEFGADFMIAKMPVDHRTKQPIGILHGGASCVLAETVGSTAGNFCVDQSQFYCVGLDINVNHIRPVKDQFVFAKATPYHLGKTTQVWQIDLTNSEGKISAVGRLTMSVLART